MPYAELHCHSYYSFHDGASSLEELLLRAKELGYRALALTDHNNLCGAMRFAQLTRSLEMQGIIGAEITLKGGYHLTLLAKDRQGYRNLCRLITAAHNSGERDTPELPPELLPEHAAGLIALSGCPQGELSQLVAKSRFAEARNLIRQYLDWFGRDNYYLELQQNLVSGRYRAQQKAAGPGQGNGRQSGGHRQCPLPCPGKAPASGLPGGHPALQEPGRDPPGTAA